MNPEVKQETNEGVSNDIVGDRKEYQLIRPTGTANSTNEFSTVDLLLRSHAETRGVDAFALSVIKAERQARKLVTHLVYQFPAFGPADVPALRNALVSNKAVYFDGFLSGFDALYPRPIQSLVGPEFARLKGRLEETADYRNKIFHGQLTIRDLTREELVELSTDIWTWCASLGTSAEAEIGYDGFGRPSFQKSRLWELWKRFKVSLNSVADYDAFIRANMERKR